MHPLVRLLAKKEKLVIGLMSGTSQDGIDAALVKIVDSGLATKIELINFQTIPYPQSLRSKLIDIAQPGRGTVEVICRLNVVVGEYFADAAIEICRLSKMDMSCVDLIGSHGQTIHHLPVQETCFDKSIRSTLQIGEPAVIARRTGIITVANFRPADMAVGGQGAPLVPYFDLMMFRSSGLNRVILNIGGIANITILRKKCVANDVMAYDAGPGNMVIDALMKTLFRKDYDENGAIAFTGSISEPVLAELLQHPFFHQPPPKSTGREEFGDAFVERMLNAARRYQLKPEDIIATATELTARSIAGGIKFSRLPVEEIDELIMSGGGVHNQALMNSIKKYFHHSRVRTTDEFDLPGDAKEAICFAVLANETIVGNPANLPSVTGAKQATILGSICLV